MFRALLLVAIVVCALLSISRAVTGHGRGAQLPPGYSGWMGDKIKPPTSGPGSPGAPGGAGAGGGPATPPPGQPGIGTPPGGAGAGFAGPSTGGRGGKKRPRATSPRSWQLWWETHRDRYLDLRGRVGAGTVQTGSTAFLTGMGRAEMANLSRRPTQSEIEDRIVPVLREALDESDSDILDSALLALGRVVPAGSAGSVRSDIRRMLRSSSQTVQEAAVLSLGVLGCRSSVPLLTAILEDDREGRAALGERRAVPARLRSFAALSLGLIGWPVSVSALMRVIQQEGSGLVGLRCCAIASLGLFLERREEIVRFLVDLSADRTLHHAVRAQIPVALGRLGERAEATLPLLVRAVRSRKSEVHYRESSLLALGAIASPEDEQIRDLLHDSVDGEDHAPARHFASIALARIGARSDRDGRGEVVRNDLVRESLRQFVRPRNPVDRPWSALSLALLGRSLGRENPRRATIGDRLEEAFEATGNPADRAALALSLGLLDRRKSADRLFEELEKASDPQLKGYLAEALGMLRHRPAAGPLRLLLTQDRSPTVRLSAATALSLMQDRDAVPVLMESLARARTLAEVASCSQAVGRLGDRRALPGLIRIIEDRQLSGLARGFACVALGLLAEKTDLPWNTRLKEHANYRALVPELAEVFDIL